MVKMQLKGSAGCTHAGTAYEADEDGIIEVPEEAVETLKSHGFTTEVDTMKKEAEEAETEEAETGSRKRRGK